MIDRKDPSMAFWAAVFLSLTMLYGLSFGPACWIRNRACLPDWADGALVMLYQPVGWIANDGPAPIKVAIEWYAEFFWPSRQPEYLGNQLM
jgi:hypothetical protein